MNSSTDELYFESLQRINYTLKAFNGRTIPWTPSTGELYLESFQRTPDLLLRFWFNNGDARDLLNIKIQTFEIVLINKQG